MPNLGFLNAPSFANVQGIGSIPLVRLERRIGVLPTASLAEVRRAVAARGRITDELRRSGAIDLL